MAPFIHGLPADAEMPAASQQRNAQTELRDIDMYDRPQFVAPAVAKPKDFFSHHLGSA